MDGPPLEQPVRRLPAKIWLPVGLAVALVVGLAAWALARPQAEGAGKTVPDGAPAFSLPRLGGGPPVTLPADRPVVVNFFASWCPDCRQELASFAAEAKASAGKVDFVGIDTSETSPAAAAALVAKAGVRYPVGLDNRGVTAGAYGIAFLPTTVFVSGGGTIASNSLGTETIASLRTWVQRLERS